MNENINKPAFPFQESHDEKMNVPSLGLTKLEYALIMGHYEPSKDEIESEGRRDKFDERLILVSNALVQQPLFVIVAMLIEENEHFNTGLSDNTREFQQHFINLYTRQLLAAEKIEI